MGFFGNIKKILFEDDEEEINSMPVYSDKEEIKENHVDKKEVVNVEPMVEEPVKVNEDSRFTNIKRDVGDVGFSFDDNDLLDEIPEVKTDKNMDFEMPVKKEEKKSVFMPFDEDEFDRLNSRVNRNENRVRQDLKNNSVPNVDARRANSNFSSTTTVRDNRLDNDRYKINSTPAKKSFTPSPIISPVYGILDKNYTKEDIVDKKDGMKREKIVKPVVKKDEGKTIAEAEAEIDSTENTIVIEKSTSVVDIDSVRKKAYGELEDLEKTLTELKLSDLQDVDVVEDEPSKEVNYEEIDTSVEDELESNFSVEDIEIDENEKELDKVVDEVIEEKPRVKPQLLDDLEKTSTLQILDDIEKELNSIKPITKDIDEDIDIEPRVHKDDTLEKDLFNLIDSMYEDGEEEEEND